jgi:hypothetical protein
MRRSLAVLALIVGALCATGLPAHAGPALQRITIDRVDFEPSPIWGYARLRAFVSALDLGASGKVMPITGDGAWKIKIAGGDKSIPYFAATYANADSNLAIVIVVETAFEYSTESSPGAGTDLHVIQAALDDLLTKLPPRTQVAVIGYGSGGMSYSKLGSVKTAQARLAKLTAEEETGSPQLLAALAKALQALKNVQTDPENQPVRKLVILVSDGRDKTEEQKDITKMGVAAAKAGVEIDSVAYRGTAPSKGTLINLAEMSKQSHGAFRWAEQITSMNARVANVASEINDEYVLTWLVEPEEVAGKKLAVTGQVGSVAIASQNEPKIPDEPTCSGASCGADGYCASYKCVTHAKPKGRGAFGWILIIVGIALGGLIVLLVVGVVFTKLQRKPKPPPGFVMPGAPAPGAAAPGFAPGAPAPGAVGTPPPAVAPPAPVGGPQLYMMSGPRSGQRIGLRHGFLIGKQPGCDLVLEDDGFASSQHAQILMDTGGNCTLVDKGSTNGTFVNGVRVTQYALTHGVAIRVGSTELRFLAQ